MVLVIGGLMGMILGGWFGARQFGRDVDEAIRKEGFADFLPVAIPVWALVGGIFGIMASWSLWQFRRGPWSSTP